MGTVMVTIEVGDVAGERFEPLEVMVTRDPLSPRYPANYCDDWASPFSGRRRRNWPTEAWPR